MNPPDDQPWIDVTVPVRDGMVHWPGDPAVRVVKASDLERGDEVTVSRLDLGAHTGTHVDAPVHYLPGTGGIDSIAPEALIGPARVVAVPAAPVITREIVDALGVSAGERIVFRTRNSDRAWKTDSFAADYTYLSLEGAQLLVERGVRTVGVDYLSVGGGADGPATHRVLLSAGVCIIEGLDLGRVEPGPYDLCCLPLLIAGADGAPARALLRRRKA